MLLEKSMTEQKNQQMKQMIYQREKEAMEKRKCDHDHKLESNKTTVMAKIENEQKMKEEKDREIHELEK